MSALLEPPQHVEQPPPANVVTQATEVIVISDPKLTMLGYRQPAEDREVREEGAFPVAILFADYKDATGPRSTCSIAKRDFGWIDEATGRDVVELRRTDGSSSSWLYLDELGFRCQEATAGPDGAAWAIETGAAPVVTD